MYKKLSTALKLSALLLPLGLAACATNGDLKRVEATANQAQTTATQANQTANAAQTTANEAIQRANQAQTTANEAMNRVNQLQQQAAAQPAPAMDQRFDKAMNK